jgi:hypothetical protein
MPPPTRCCGADCGRWCWRHPAVRPGRGLATSTASRSSRPPGTAPCPGCRSRAPTVTATRTATRPSPTSPPTPTPWTPRSAPTAASARSAAPATASQWSWGGGGRLSARAVVAASGTFGRPHRPALPGLEEYAGQVLHAADYRSPAPFTGRRVVVVGAGNSAVQIAAELATMRRCCRCSSPPTVRCGAVLSAADRASDDRRGGGDSRADVQGPRKGDPKPGQPRLRLMPDDGSDTSAASSAARLPSPRAATPASGTPTAMRTACRSCPSMRRWNSSRHSACWPVGSTPPPSPRDNSSAGKRLFSLPERPVPGRGR